MLSLFVFFVHGGTSSFKMAMRPALNKESAITIGVNNKNGHVEISGCTAIENLLRNQKEWFVPNSEDPMALFKQLFVKVKEEYTIDPNKICLYCEGNYGELAGNILAIFAVQMINFTQPAYALLPTGTPECCRFINYWSDHYHYKKFNLQQAFINAENYYSPAVSEQKSIELQPLIQARALTCRSPFIATFNKELSYQVIEEVYAAMYTIAPLAPVLSTREQKVEEELTVTERYISNNRVSDPSDATQRQKAYFDVDPNKVMEPIFHPDSNASTLSVTPMNEGKSLQLIVGAEFTANEEPMLSDAVVTEMLSRKPVSQKKKIHYWGVFSCCKYANVVTDEEGSSVANTLS